MSMPITTPRLVSGTLAVCLGIGSLAGAATWQSDATLPGAKRYAFGARQGGTIYAIGGTPWVNGSDQDGTVYARSGGTWTELPPLDGMGAIIPLGGGVDDLGRIVMFGGIVLDNGEPGDNKVYDPIEGPQDTIADPSADAQPLGFAVATDDLGRLYWLGGGNGAGGGNSAHGERYTGSTDSWQTIADMPAAVAEACACFDGNGHVLVFGGFVANGSSRTADVKQYDVASNTWSDASVPDMPVAVSGARAVRGVDDRIYVIGGVTGAGSVSATVQVLDLYSNTWSFGPSLNTARQQFAAVLGADDFIFVIGGADASGVSLNTVERLFTSTCPGLSGPAVAIETFAGQTAAIAANVSGSGPLSYEWTHDGAPVENGPTSSGSIISGADGAVLTIGNAGVADAGAYGVTATNECGTISGPVAILSVQVPPAVPTTWAVTTLHPGWATSSTANCVSGPMQGGAATIDTPDYSNLSQPVTWSGSAASAVNLTPGNSVGGGIRAMDGDIVAGWWWWPYQCYISGQWYTCYSSQAAMWIGGPGGFDNLQVSGWEYSGASTVRDGIVGGSITNDDASGNYWWHAGTWEPPNYTFHDLHPGAGASSSSVSALDGAEQYGQILTPYPGPTYHAAKWSGSAASFVDLHPAGYSASFINDAADGQQVGYTGYPYDGAKACMWTGTPGSFVSLHPDGATLSHVYACSAGLQFGDATIGGVTRPVFWSGSASSMTELSLPVPDGFTSVTVNDFEIAPDGTFTIVGFGYHAAATRNEALMWTSTVGVPGDLNGDGHVDGTDLALLLAAWGTADDVADLNEDGIVNSVDLGMLLAAWG